MDFVEVYLHKVSSKYNLEIHNHKYRELNYSLCSGEIAVFDGGKGQGLGSRKGPSSNMPPASGSEQLNILLNTGTAFQQLRPAS